MRKTGFYLTVNIHKVGLTDKKNGRQDSLQGICDNVVAVPLLHEEKTSILDFVTYLGNSRLYSVPAYFPRNLHLCPYANLPF